MKLEDLFEATIKLKKSKSADALAAFMNDFYSGTEQHPFDRKIRIWNGSVGIEASKFGDQILLDAIISFEEKGKGNASAALKWFCDLADKHKVEIELSVVPLANAGSKIGKSLTKAQLTSWYKKFGFKSGFDEYMTRAPK